MFYKRLFNRGAEEGADFAGTVALRGDHMSFFVHRGQPTRDEETRKCERDKPRRHCDTIMKALLSTMGCDLSRTRDFLVLYALSAGSSSPRPVTVGSCTTRGLPRTLLLK